MLLPEVEPFANYHIEKLKKLRETLLSSPNLHSPDMEEGLDDLRNAINALNRFKICMVDEHKMKERYRLTARMCRLHHMKD